VKDEKKKKYENKNGADITSSLKPSVAR